MNFLTDIPIYTLFSFFDEILQSLASICRRCFAAEAESKCRENGAFSTTILSDYEVYERAEVNREMFVAHKVVAVNAFNYALLKGDIKLRVDRSVVDCLGSIGLELVILAAGFTINARSA